MTTKFDFKFNIWVNQIEKHINKVLDINLDDLPDNTYRIDFESGMNYLEMASKVVKDTEWEEYYKLKLLKK